MTDGRDDFREQMQRQSTWLKESWLWIIDRMVADHRELIRPRRRALDVGCGPGVVAEIMKERMEVIGIDIDTQNADESRSRGIDVSVAAGETLPFDDNSFDLVYCTFLLLWVEEPREVVSEMKRVSKRWVACLAEPDYGGRIGFPDSVRRLDELLACGIAEAGGDPFVGRKLNSIFSSCGMKPNVGIHPGVWNVERLRTESDGEWKFIMSTASGHAEELTRLRTCWDSALEDGSLFQFNPIFYATAEK